MVDVQVVVTVAIDGGFSVEGKFRCAGVVAKIDAHMLARSGNVVINKVGTAVVPLAQDGPCGRVVGADQHEEAVVLASAGGGVFIAETSECHVEIHCGAAGERDLRSDEPVCVVLSIDVQCGVVGAEDILEGEHPAVLSGVLYKIGVSSHHLVNQAGVLGPSFLGRAWYVEFFGEAVEVRFCPVVDHVAVVFCVSAPSHIGCVGGDIGDSRGHQNRGRAGCEPEVGDIVTVGVNREGDGGIGGDDRAVLGPVDEIVQVGGSGGEGGGFTVVVGACAADCTAVDRVRGGGDVVAVQGEVGDEVNSFCDREGVGGVAGDRAMDVAPVCEGVAGGGSGGQSGGLSVLVSACTLHGAAVGRVDSDGDVEAGKFKVGDKFNILFNVELENGRS